MVVVLYHTAIANQRDDLHNLLDEKPSLRQYLPDILTKAYRNARRKASAETGITLANFDENCPYKIE
ncbi:MAG: DUF29 family protein [Nostoc sp.]|uniref:DUF29 family protein n=1 Tax=Nostoc sp. TaxID=1180 RepID=UPI002FF813C6